MIDTLKHYLLVLASTWIKVIDFSWDSEPNTLILHDLVVVELGFGGIKFFLYDGHPAVGFEWYPYSLAVWLGPFYKGWYRRRQ